MNLLVDILVWQAPLSFVAAAVVTGQLMTASSAVTPLPALIMAGLYFLVAWMVAAALVLTADLLALLLVYICLCLVSVLFR
jgi:hypothetical protein